MNKYKNMILIIPLLLIGCLFTGSDGTSIKAKLIYNNKNLSGAIVTIDSSNNWMDLSDFRGNFSIVDLTEGVHELMVLKNLDGDRYTRIDTIIIVKEGLNNLGTFELLQPVELIDFDDEIDEKEVILRWNKTNNGNFLKYELIRSNNDSHSDIAKSIIFESFSINDTSYSDKSLVSGEEYNYNLKTYFNFGRVAGSETYLLSCNEALLENGGFEEETPDIHYIPAWSDEDFSRFFSIDSLDVAEGYYSLKGEMNGQTISRMISIDQDISNEKIQGGEKYLISAKMYSINNAVLYVTLIYSTPSIYNKGLANLSNYGINEWVERSIEIVLPQDISVLKIKISILVPSDVSGYGNFNGSGYFDAIKLKKIN